MHMKELRRCIYTLNGIVHNKGPLKSIFNWNHISDELTEEQIEELKSYYQTYHKKCWAYKQASKSFKKTKITRELIVHYLCIWRCCFQYSNRWHRFDCR